MLRSRNIRIKQSSSSFGEESFTQERYYQSTGFLNKCIGILENYSESLSFFQSLFFLGGIEKKRRTQNDSLKCQQLFSKSPGSGSLITKRIFQTEGGQLYFRSLEQSMPYMQLQLCLMIYEFQ